jgi:hypothetical protein
MLRATITLLLLMAVSFGLAEPARAETAVRELTSHREAQLIADLSQRHQMNQNAANEQKFDAGRDHALKRVTSSRPTVPEYDYGKNKMPASFSRVFAPECWDAGREVDDCLPGERADEVVEAAPPTRDQVESVVRTLVARLRLPDSVPTFGPDPSVNEWNMAVVGHPLWLWVDTPDRMVTSVSGYGITIRMDAKRSGVTFAMGDGSAVRCTTMTPYSESVEAGAPSPTCGYTYSKASLPKGSYTVTATAHWAIDWSAIGYTGTIPMNIADSRELPVGELQAVVVRDR